MDASGFKTFSVKVVLYFGNVSYVHVTIYMICAVCLFGCCKMSCSVYAVDVPAKVKRH